MNAPPPSWSDRVGLRGIALRLIRWVSVATVLGALVGFWRVLDGESDAGIWVIAWSGVAGGAIGGLRMSTAGFGGPGDPRSLEGNGSIWHAYGRSFVNFVWACGAWLGGSIAITAAVLVGQGGPRSGSDVFAPLFLGLVWALAYGLAWVAVVFVLIPILCLVTALRLRASGKRMAGTWWVLGGAVAYLDVAIVFFILVFVLVPPDAVPEVTGQGALFTKIFGVSSAGLPWGTVVVLWIARVLAAILALFLAVGAFLGLFLRTGTGSRRRRRRDRE